MEMGKYNDKLDSSNPIYLFKIEAEKPEDEMIVFKIGHLSLDILKSCIQSDEKLIKTLDGISKTYITERLGYAKDMFNARMNDKDAIIFSHYQNFIAAFGEEENRYNVLFNGTQVILETIKEEVI